MNPESSIHPRSRTGLYFLIALVAAMAVFALALVLGFKAFNRAIGVAERFTSHNITQTFRSEIEKVASTHGNILELATSEGDEYFKRENEKYWGRIYMGTTVAELQAKATFRYHLQLSDRWELRAESNVCVVMAPPFRPTLPVAIHTDTMRSSASSGWARFDKNDELKSLQYSMTRELETRADDPRHREAVREECRNSVGEFVQNWLLREGQWSKDRFSAIHVIFPDDPPMQPDRKTPAPIIRLTD